MSSTARTPAVPRRTRSAPVSGAVRWDRLVRWALIAAVALMAALYAASLLGIVSASSDQSDASAELRKLESQNAALQAQRKGLRGASGVAIQARRLGMVLPGEVPVVVTGLPGDSR